MNIVDVKIKIGCDMPNCKKKAIIKVSKEGFLRSVGLYLCEDCAREVYGELGKRLVPKSLKNMLNKKFGKGNLNEK